MAASERTYTIPLRKGVMKSMPYKRAKKAVSIIKKFIIKNSKSSDVKIGKHLNLKIWAHGIKNVPCRVKVDASKDDKGTVTVELFGAPKEIKKEEGKKGKEKKAEDVKEAVVVAEKPAEKKEAAVSDETATVSKENNQKKPAKQQ